MMIGNWPKRTKVKCPCGSGFKANHEWSLAREVWILSCPTCVQKRTPNAHVRPSRNVEEDASRHAARRAIEERRESVKEVWDE